MTSQSSHYRGSDSRHNNNSLYSNRGDDHRRPQQHYKHVSHASSSQSHSRRNDQHQNRDQSSSAASSTRRTEDRAPAEKSAVSEWGDWAEFVSGSNGKTYFYNSVTEVSQWEKPTDWINHDKLTRHAHGAKGSSNRNHNHIDTDPHTHRLSTEQSNGVSSKPRVEATDRGRVAVSHSHGHAQQNGHGHFGSEDMAVSTHHLHMNNHVQPLPAHTSPKPKRQRIDVSTPVPVPAPVTNMPRPMPNGSVTPTNQITDLLKKMAGHMGVDLSKAKVPTLAASSGVSTSRQTCSLEGTDQNKICDIVMSSVTPKRQASNEQNTHSGRGSDCHRPTPSHSVTPSHSNNMSLCNTPNSQSSSSHKQRPSQPPQSHSRSTKHTSSQNIQLSGGELRRPPAPPPSLMKQNQRLNGTRPAAEQTSAKKADRPAAGANTHTQQATTSNSARNHQHQSVSANKIEAAPAPPVQKPKIQASDVPFESMPTFNASAYEHLVDMSMAKHTTGWAGETLDLFAAELEGNSAKMCVAIGNLAADLKCARSLVRTADITCSLIDSRVDYHREQFENLERTLAESSSQNASVFSTGTALASALHTLSSTPSTPALLLPLTTSATTPTSNKHV